MTKKDLDVYKRYMISRDYSLFDVYGSFSKRKRDAWEYCKRLCKQNDGIWLKVLGANSNFFSAAFMYDNGNKLMYITHSNDRTIDISNVQL